MGTGKAGFFSNSALEHGRSRNVLLLVEPEHVLESQVVEAPRVKIFGRAEAGSTRLVRRDLQLQRRNSFSNDLHAKLEYAGQRRGVALSPHYSAISDIDEFNIDGQGMSLGFEGAGETISYAQPVSDLWNVKVWRTEPE